MSIQRMTRIALLSAILYVSKVVLEFLPNIELVSLLVILYSLVFGWEAMLIVTVFNLFELIQWGFGTWWFSYLYVWPLLCVITMLLKKLIKEEFLIWTDLRITVCVVLPVCGSEVCACLLDQRTALGCGALYREFCADADSWEAVV